MSHLFWARREFRSQVPPWVPMDPDAVVVGSGVVEVGLGAALVALPRERERIGTIVAAFFIAVFPGNLAQWAERRGAFGLTTDRARFIRLFFQPLLVALAVWSRFPPVDGAPPTTGADPSRAAPRLEHRQRHRHDERGRRDDRREDEVAVTVGAAPSASAARPASRGS